MKYLVVEIQTDEQEQVTNLPYEYSDKPSALEKFHNAASYAAKQSTAMQHTVCLLDIYGRHVVPPVSYHHQPAAPEETPEE